jgi:electron transfer flavoprotein beta subunit
MGADAAYLLSDRAFGGADTLATSLTLSEGIKAIGDFDLILCGDESSDGATGQVPPAIAEWLDLPQITYANRLKLVDGCLRARRQLHAGFEDVEARLPCLVSLVQDINEPRFLDFGRFDWAMREAPVTVWSAQDLGIDPGRVGLDGSPTTVAGVSLAKGGERRREFISGTPAEITEKLLEKIRPWVRSA